MPITRMLIQYSLHSKFSTSFFTYSKRSYLLSIVSLSDISFLWPSSLSLLSCWLIFHFPTEKIMYDMCNLKKNERIEWWERIENILGVIKMSELIIFSLHLRVNLNSTCDSRLERFDELLFFTFLKVYSRKLLYFLYIWNNWKQKNSGKILLQLSVVRRFVALHNIDKLFSIDASKRYFRQKLFETWYPNTKLSVSPLLF